MMAPGQRHSNPAGVAPMPRETAPLPPQRGMLLLTWMLFSCFSFLLFLLLLGRLGRLGRLDRLDRLASLASATIWEFLLREVALPSSSRS